MSITDRLTRYTVLELIETIADRAEGFAEQAGVGGMETAGAIISYLVEHPQDIEPFMVGGVFELPEKWFAMGRLTWQAKNGKVVHPREVRPNLISAAEMAALSAAKEAANV